MQAHREGEESIGAPPADCAAAGDTPDLYVPFVPARLVRHHVTDPEPPAQARTEICSGVVLFVDVIGYTQLTESYSQRGTEGVEQLMALLNGFFAHLENVISAHGGDIVSFAGDSLLALWDDAGTTGTAGSARLAVQCACAAQEILERPKTGDRTRLRLRVGLGAGELSLSTLGGYRGDWKYVAGGAPITSALHALKGGRAGVVVVAGEVWPLIDPYCTGASAGGDCFEVASVIAPAPLPASIAIVPGGTNASVLRSYIPRPVLDHLDVGQRDWLAEFRHATTAFVALHGRDGSQGPAPAELQDAIVLVQQTVARYEGTVARIGFDDKGTNLLCVWGLPGQRHEDDPRRAVAMALAVHAGLGGIGVGCATGISTGRVLCGLAGGGSRYEYTVTGDTVNLASRLMVAAGSGILCDIPTSESAGAAIAFERLAPITVRGREGAVPVARPSPVHTRLRHAAPPGVPSAFVGRSLERDCLVAQLRRLLDGAGTLVTVDGEPGVGKSRLMAELVAAAQEWGVHAVTGYADAIEPRTTYYIYRAIVDGVLARRCGGSNAARRAHLDRHFLGRPLLHSWLPLLNDVLPLGFAQTAVSRGMTEEARAESTAELLVDLLRDEFARTATLLVLEDVHWMDSMSWLVTARLREGAQPLLLVLVMRSRYIPVTDSAQALLRAPGNVHLGLETLAGGEVEALLRHRLGAGDIAPEVAAFVQERTAGNPLFAEELAYAMRDRGHLLLEDGRWSFAQGGSAPAADELPRTIHGVIATRIDGLTASQQLTLKVASVCGRWFMPELVQSMRPLPLGPAQLAAELETFAALDLVRPDGDDSGMRYRFKHSLTQEVAYAGLLPTQQRQFHHAAGAWYEARHGADLPTVYPLLAHHWKQADDLPKATRYHYLSGEQAFHRYALSEAVRFLDDALVMLQRQGPAGAPGLQADCHRVLGLSWVWLGDMEKSQRCIETSFALRGRAIPPRRRLIVHVIAQSAAYIGIRLVGRCAPVYRRDATPAERDAATAMLRLGHVTYYMGDNLLAFYTSLRVLNFAEHRRYSAETAVIYAAMVIGAGMVLLHGLARRYVALALRAARSMKDPSISSQVMVFISIYEASVCRWRESAAHAERAAELSRRVGASRRIDECMVVRGYVHFHKGALGDALRAFEQAAAGGRARGDRQAAGWGVLGIARTRLAQNRPDDALTALHEAAPLAADRLSSVELHGQLAVAHLCRHELDRALGSARTGLALVSGARQTSFSTLTGTAGIAETLISLWAFARAGTIAEQPAVLCREARAALRALRQLALIFPVARPQALLARAAYAQVRGRHRQALRLLRRSREAATRSGMEYEEARIALALGRSAAGAERERELARASAICAKLGIPECAPLPANI